MTAAHLRCLTIAFTSMAFGLLLAVAATAQDLPTAKPEDVGVSSAKVEELSKFMQSPCGPGQDRWRRDDDGPPRQGRST